MKLLTAVNRFVRDAPWLGVEHGPLVEGLRAIARDMDATGVTASGLSQYRMLTQALLDARSLDRTGLLGLDDPDTPDDPDLGPLA